MDFESIMLGETKSDEEGEILYFTHMPNIKKVNKLN